MVEEEGGEPDEVGGAPSLNKFSVTFFISDNGNKRWKEFYEYRAWLEVLLVTKEWNATEAPASGLGFTSKAPLAGAWKLAGHLRSRIPATRKLQLDRKAGPRVFAVAIVSPVGFASRPAGASEARQDCARTSFLSKERSDHSTS